MGAVLRERYILIFTKRWIHLYMLPRREDPFAAPIRLGPTARHRWPFRIDSIVFAPRVHHRKGQFSEFGHGEVDPIDMFIRFDTFYPWPINLLHHFILPPNHAYSGDCVQDSTFAHNTNNTNNSSGSLPPALLPYLHCAPMMATMISSPLRLFTPSDMVIGRHGTVVWLDAMTDASTPSVAADLGQRIMGTILSRSPLPSALDPSAPGLYSRALLTMSSSSVTANVADVVAGGGGRVRGGEASGGLDKDASRNPLMTFHVRQESDGWNKVAVDDEQGLVAIGSVDGSLTVYDYAPL